MPKLSAFLRQCRAIREMPLVPAPAPDNVVALSTAAGRPSPDPHRSAELTQLLALTEHLAALQLHHESLHARNAALTARLEAALRGPEEAPLTTLYRVWRDLTS